MTAIHARSYKRTSPVTDTKSAKVSITTEVAREVFVPFDKAAKALGTTRSALLRKLIEEYVARDCGVAARDLTHG
jgi:hypothetical protein